jgi:multidrug efflux pump subunit AcrA (membrane-fusion protein)
MSARLYPVTHLIAGRRLLEWRRHSPARRPRWHAAGRRGRGDARAQAVPRTSEYVASIQSLASATVQPQVEGILTRIHVRSGDRVRAGQLLAEINPDKQQASVASLEASRAAREADLAFAKQQLTRMQTLFEAGAVSRQELEQAETALETAQAQLERPAVADRAGQVELGYYRVTAPGGRHRGDVCPSGPATASRRPPSSRPSTRRRGWRCRWRCRSSAPRS